MAQAAVNGAGFSKRALYWQRKQSLYNERASFFSHYKELSQFYLPRSGRFMISDRNRGDKRYNNIYDNTGTRSLRTLAAGLMAGMTSPARPWFRLATQDDKLMESAAVKDWLDDCTRVMRNIFNQSNTYRALQTVYEEIACFGTGATLVLPDFKDVIRHYPLTVGEYALGTNSRGEVNTLVREFEMTVTQIVSEFGLENCSQNVQSLYSNGKGLDQWIPVCHIIEPRSDRDPSKQDALNMAWASCWFESGAQEDKLLRESGFKRFPVLAPRWNVAGGDVYGTSCPGMEGLGDVKQLQHGQLRKAQAIDYMVKPPIQAPSSAKNREIDTLPGGVSFVDMVNGGGMKAAFEVKIDLTGQLEDIRDVRERIRQTFFADLFLMISEDERSGVTAREIAERHEEKLLMLGPVLERLHNELLKQKIDITFDAMMDAGIVPPPPEEIHGQQINVEFVSMLAQAQKAVGAQNTDRFIQSVGAVAQFIPTVLDNFDGDAYVRIMADDLGVDPDLLKTPDKVQAARQAQAQQAQAQAKMQAMDQMASTAKTASQAQTSQPSALSNVMDGLTGYSTGAPQ